jgi:hypothetical protein
MASEDGGLYIFDDSSLHGEYVVSRLHNLEVATTNKNFNAALYSPPSLSFLTSDNHGSQPYPRTETVYWLA